MFVFCNDCKFAGRDKDGHWDFSCSVGEDRCPNRKAFLNLIHEIVNGIKDTNRKKAKQ